MDNYRRVVIDWASPEHAEYVNRQFQSTGPIPVIANYGPANTPEFKPNRRQRRAR